MQIETTIKEALDQVRSKITSVKHLREDGISSITKSIEQKTVEVEKVTTITNKLKSLIRGITFSNFVDTKEIVSYEKSFIFFRKEVKTTKEEFNLDKFLNYLSGETGFPKSSLEVEKARLFYKGGETIVYRDFMDMSIYDDYIGVSDFTFNSNTYTVYMYVGKQFFKCKDYVYKTTPSIEYERTYPRYKSLLEELDSLRKEIYNLQKVFGADKVVTLDDKQIKLLGEQL